MDHGVSLVAHELRTSDLGLIVIVIQGLIEVDSLTVNRGDAAHLECLVLIHPHTDQRPGLEPPSAAQCHRRFSGQRHYGQSFALDC